MRWFLTSTALVVAVFPAAVIAQPLETPSSLLADLAWVRLGVSAGRITLSSPKYQQSRTNEIGNPLVGTRETVTLTVDPPTYSIHYLQETPDLQVTFDGSSSQEFEFAQSPRGDGRAARIQLVQPREGPLRLTFGAGGGAVEYSGETLWHLLMSLPAEPRRQLLDLLEPLRSEWNLAATADEIESALLEVAGNEIPDRAKWQRLVAQLDSPLFAERRSAQRRLREAGPAVVPFLRSVRPESLSTEGRGRLQSLLDTLASTTDDTPGRIATWLVDDVGVWVSLLASESVEKRSAAARHLQGVLGRTLEFSPDAPADQRTRQLAALRRELGLPD